MRIKLLPHKADFGDVPRSPRHCFCGYRAYCFDDEREHTKEQQVRRGAALIGYILVLGVLLGFLMM